MSDTPNELVYSKSHEWVRVEGEVAVIGITYHAQQLLGDMVFVELPEEGETFDVGDELAVVESVKAASDVYAPFSGEVCEINSELEESPALVNSDPFGDGWLVKMQIKDTSELSELLSAEDYTEMVEKEV